jgi:hypothetical protein
MKPIYQSKTFWLNLLALVCLFVPAVQAWLAANPVDFPAALVAANLILRFLTKGAVTILPGSAGPETSDTECEETGRGRLSSWLLLAGLGGLVGFSSPACSPVGAAPPVPLRVIYARDGIVAGYSSKAGLDLTIDRRSGK